LTIEGVEVDASAEVLETESAAEQALLEYLTQVPHQARFFKVGLDEEAKPSLPDVRTAAESRVMVRFKIQAT
jgi:hypothetical protein